MRFFLKKSFSDGLRSMNHPIFNPNRATASGHGKTDHNTCGKDKKKDAWPWPGISAEGK